MIYTKVFFVFFNEIKVFETMQTLSLICRQWIKKTSQTISQLFNLKHSNIDCSLTSVFCKNNGHGCLREKRLGNLCVKMFGLFCQSVFICRTARNQFPCTIVLLLLLPLYKLNISNIFIHVQSLNLHRVWIPSFWSCNMLHSQVKGLIT